jgi:Ubiquitin-activating enzyme E1 FCCH domain
MMLRVDDGGTGAAYGAGSTGVTTGPITNASTTTGTITGTGVLTITPASMFGINVGTLLQVAYGETVTVTAVTGTTFTARFSLTYSGATYLIATSPITIASAGHGLNTGDVVNITGVAGNTAANGTWVVTMVDANSFSLQQSLGIAPYASGGNWQAVSFPATQWLQQAVMVGTSKVNRFAQPLYNSAQLVNSWSCWNWATICGAQWLCARRNNPIPDSLLNLYLESMDELAMVKAQTMVIEDVAYRNECLPSWVNLRVNRAWSVKQLRAEAGISGRTPVQYPRHWDLSSQIIAPCELNSLTI